MASEKQILINYNQAKSCAASLEEEASRLKKLADSEFSASIAELRSAWKGENAELYTQKCEQLKGEMLGTAKTLVSVASSIRTRAKAIYDAEMENIRLFQTRSAEAASTVQAPSIQANPEQVSSKEVENEKIKDVAENAVDAMTSIAKGLFKGIK